MKKLLSILCVLAAASCGVAQAQKAPKVAVVDLPAVAAKYQKAQALEQLLKNDIERFRKQAQDDEQQLRALAAELQKTQSEAQSPVLTEQGRKNAREVLQKRGQEFEQRRQEFGNKQRAAEATIQQRARGNNEQIMADIRPIVATIAKERSVDLVLPAGTTLFAVPELDITEELVKRLNAENPPPAVPAATPAAPSAPAATGGPSNDLAPLPTAPAPAASR